MRVELQLCPQEGGGKAMLSLLPTGAEAKGLVRASVGSTTSANASSNAAMSPGATAGGAQRVAPVA